MNVHFCELAAEGVFWTTAAPAVVEPLRMSRLRLLLAFLMVQAPPPADWKVYSWQKQAEFCHCWAAVLVAVEPWGMSRYLPLFLLTRTYCPVPSGGRAVWLRFQRWQPQLVPLHWPAAVPAVVEAAVEALGISRYLPVTRLVRV